jgi:small subunit ribosomal protein S2
MLLGGIRSMVKVPNVIFVVDVMREATAIHEANILKIPVIGMVDTNCDPRDVDYVIPSNDDAIRAIKLMVGKIADAAVEGRAMRKEEEVEEVPVGMAAHAFPEEPELTDEELLGEATLAKLSTKVEALAEEDVAAFVEIEEEVVDVEGVEEEAEAESEEAAEDLPEILPSGDEKEEAA